jgi:hypothetical protein
MPIHHTILLPEHGDYDKKNQKWFCSRWIDKKQWLEIHGYTPTSTDNKSDEEEQDVFTD